MNSTNVSPDTAILHRTAEFGSKNQILRLLEEAKADLNRSNENGDTVLHLIFRNENLVERDIANLLKTFLDRGVDPNTVNKREETILHAAVVNRMKSVVELLISYGADVDKSDKEGNSVAHLFVQDERNKFLERLKLDKGRSSKVEEMEGESASFVELLIEKGVNFDRENKKKESALYLTVDYNLQHILIKLLKHTRDVNFVDRYNKSLLHLFLEKNYDFVYQYLVCGQLDNILFDTNLDWYYGYTSRYATRIVKLLLEKGASAVALDRLNVTPLRVAVENQETSIVEAMIDHLKSCETNSVFLELYKSCAWWSELRTEYFLTVLGDLTSKGVDVNTRDKSGMAPVYHAFHCKNRRAADFLADRGADFTVSSVEGENLFHALARKHRRVESDDPTLEALFELLANKSCCDLNAKNRDDETPLHLAAKSGNLAIVRKLIEHGAEVDCKNMYKETPLHMAVQCNQSEELVEFLLENGADVNSKDHRGRRPLLRVVYSANEQNPLLSLLLKWEAYVNVRKGNQSALCTAIRFGCSSDISDRSVVGFLRNVGTDERWTKAYFMLLHWMKLMAAGLPRAEEYGTFFNQGYENRQVYRACLKEIKTFKATFIDGRTSIYAFLHMDVGGRRIYTNNENFKKIVDCQNLEQHFPQYKDVILDSYRETVLWKSLLEPAKRALFQLTNIQLPYEYCELIFAYFGNQDLVNIIECNEDV